MNNIRELFRKKGDANFCEPEQDRGCEYAGKAA